MQSILRTGLVAGLVITGPGCADPPRDDDTAPATTVATGDETTAGDASAGPSTGGGTTGSSEGGPVDSSSGTGVVTFDAVSPVYTQMCGPCHVSASFGGHDIGSRVVADGFADSQLDANSPACAGLSVGACTLIRIQSGSMPMGLGCTGDPAQDSANDLCLTQEQQLLIRAWIDGGEAGPG
ncbi:MAG: hypothetical protein K0V04_01165 [Deltaproteobacteria bacterium]|nr:hypothetical protein [Deltaproteobacteria bacterium]